MSALSLYDLTGDPFQSDRCNVQVFGIEIFDSESNLVLGLCQTPESKCNTVCVFPKAEGVAQECRIRKTLLRIIHTVSSEKLLLRGHISQILDLKFSVAGRRNTVCSVDEAPTQEPHTFIWELDDSSTLSHTIVGQYSIPASQVQPHPILANVWAIVSNGNGIAAETTKGHIGLVCSNIPADSLKSYSDIPVHIILGGNEIISDVAFSSDGRFLAASVVTKGELKTSDGFVGVIIWRVPVNETLLSNVGTSPSENGLVEFARIASPDVIAIKFVANGLVMASQIPRESCGEREAQHAVDVLIQVIPFDGISREDRGAAQRITVTLPLTGEDAVGGSPHLEFALSSTLEAHPKFIVLSHRRSRLVACLAMNPNGSRSSRPPIYHATFLDLKVPAESLGCAIIAGRDHHSTDEVEHLELACYQPQAEGGAAVQQFHVPTASICAPLQAEGHAFQTQAAKEDPPTLSPTPVSPAKAEEVREGTENPADDASEDTASPVGTFSQALGDQLMASISAPSVRTTPVSSLYHANKPVESLALSFDVASAPAPVAAPVAEQLPSAALTSAVAASPSMPLAPIPSPVSTSDVLEISSAASGAVPKSSLLAQLLVSELKGGCSTNTPAPAPAPLPNNGAAEAAVEGKFPIPKMAPFPPSPLVSAQATPETSLADADSLRLPSSLPLVAPVFAGTAVERSPSSGDDDLVPLSVLPPPQVRGPPRDASYSKPAATPMPSSSTTSLPPSPSLTGIPLASADSSNQGQSILNMIKGPRHQRESTEAPPPSAPTPTSTPSFPPVINVSSVPPTSGSGPAPAPAAVPVLAPVVGAGPIAGRSLLSMLKGGQTTAPPPSIPDVLSAIAAQVDTNGHPEQKHELVHEEFGNPVGPSNDEGEAASVSLEDDFDDDDEEDEEDGAEGFDGTDEDRNEGNDDREDFIESADKSANDEVEIEDAEGSVVISASDWRLLLGELRQLREELSRSRLGYEMAKVSAEATSQAPTPALASAAAAAQSDELKQVLADAAERSIQAVDAAVKSAVADQSTRSSQQLAAVVKDTVKKALEAETKKNIDNVLRPKPLADEISKQMVERLQGDLAAGVSQRLKDSVKDMVKDSVKASLASTFRTAFENSLLPAFQAGTDRMFAQLRECFDEGMVAMGERAKAMQALESKSHEELMAEVVALREAVAAMETQLVQIKEAAAASIAGNTAASASTLVDPLELLQSGGSVSDAVECALEHKDVAVLVRLLDELSGPAQLTSQCGALVQLCAVQQLAADVADNVPAEGMSKRLEWLKSLVMGLMFNPTLTAELDTEAHLKPVLATVHANLFAAEQRLRGSGEGEGAVTDLRMLMTVVATKM